MAIKVIDTRRFNTINTVSNIPTQKEVVMSKVNAIVVKQSNPKQEEKVMKMYTESEVQQMIAYALSKKVQPQEVVKKQQVMRISAQTQEEVAPIKVKADMHAAGVKAYQTRIHNQQGHVFVEVAKKYQPGQTFTITVDSGLPTVKTLRAKYDSRSGRLHSFRVKVEKQVGKPGYSYYYLPIAIQL